MRLARVVVIRERPARRRLHGDVGEPVVLEDPARDFLAGHAGRDRHLHLPSDCRLQPVLDPEAEQQRRDQEREVEPKPLMATNRTNVTGVARGGLPAARVDHNHDLKSLAQSEVTLLYIRKRLTITSGRGNWPDETAATGTPVRQVRTPAASAQPGAGEREDGEAQVPQAPSRLPGSGAFVVSGSWRQAGWRTRHGRSGEGAADARARAQAEPGGAPEAREEPARDARPSCRP